jgi:O-antigen ligase
MELSNGRRVRPKSLFNPTRRGSMRAIFFALTGTLIATSVANIGASGIPFFYLAFFLPVAALAFPDARLTWHHLHSRSLHILVLIGAVGAALFATTVLQLITLDLKDPGSEVTHLVSRLCFLAYFAICQTCLQEETVSKTLVWLRRFLIIVCVYGAYQLAAKQLDLPLFLDWLRNNQSFYTYEYDTAGWIALVRATSIYAEPSQATVPILVLFILNIRLKTKPLSKFTGWLALLLFTMATFSRSAWAVLLTAAVVSFLFRSATLCRLAQTKRQTVAVASLLLLVIMPVWGFIRANGEGDLSAQERSAGIVLGVYMIKDAPVLGLGWNSFGVMAQHYAALPVDLDATIDFSMIHNTVVSYVQQAGLAGFLLASLPIILLARWSTAPAWMTCTTLASFLVASEIGDIGYSSLTWLWIALLINMNAREASSG